MTNGDQRRDLERVLRILEDAPSVDRGFMAPETEFRRRVEAVNNALGQRGHNVGFVFSDEHYDGDVPYLGGNVNLSIEQCCNPETG